MNPFSGGSLGSLNWQGAGHHYLPVARDAQARDHPATRVF
jgi:hypothetical protein